MVEDRPGPIQLQRIIQGYLDEGRWMEAMVVAKKAMALFPEEPRFRVMLAEGLKHLR